MESVVWQIKIKGVVI